ncbi:MAG: hypothetical protein JSV91_07920 [Phycisphaerales bacterium]|nr:MAG: hypothetical protein JSV91_07920 [Phycisphaerales bacterium]
MNDPTAGTRAIECGVISERGEGISAESGLDLLRRIMRSRWRISVVAALLLAIVGGFIVYRCVPLTYQSSGMVYVEGQLPVVLFDCPENEVPPLFDAFVWSQASLLQSREVIDVAVSRPEMSEAGWPAGPAGVAELQESLQVRREKGEQMIHVAVQHDDPRLAHTAVNAVLASFEELSGRRNGPRPEETLRILTRREQELLRLLAQLRADILEASDQYGSDAIARIHAEKVEELIALDRRLAEITLMRDETENGEYLGLWGPSGAAGRAAGEDSLTDLKDRELALMAEIESFSTAYGPNHPVIRELARRLEAIRIRGELTCNAMPYRGKDPRYDRPGLPPITRATRRRLRRDADWYQAMRDRVREETAGLERQRLVVNVLDEQADRTRQRLVDTQRRLDEIRVENSVGDRNRVSIVAFGDLPAAPVSDRRLGYALTGGFLLAAAAFGLAAMIGLLNPRARFHADLAAMGPGLPVLGVLPELGDGNELRDEPAARSVHQLRNLIELSEDATGGAVHAISSSLPGEGKTSVALAIAASLAAGGRKTLIIDGDIARGGMTRRLGLDHRPGLCGAIGPRRETGKAHPLQQGNLWIMPTGSSGGLRPEEISRRVLIRLLDELRTTYDAVLIDTGPVMTSVEAPLIAGVSDDVLLVVERNRKQRTIRSALHRLNQAGARVCGMVLNRAAQSDIAGGERELYVCGGEAAQLVPGVADALHEQVAGGASVLPIRPKGSDASGRPSEQRQAA